MRRGGVAVRSACVALALVSAASWLEAKANAAARSERGIDDTMTSQIRGDRAGHLTSDSSIQDLLFHAAFAGYGRLILPWDDCAYDESMRLRNISALLPYHSQVNPGDVVTALNCLIDDVSKGQTVFYEIYTWPQKQQEPSRDNTGLIYFRGRPGAPFAIISPGGGFAYVGSLHEGFPYAAAISKKGYNAFVLRYRARQGEAIATQDLAAALSYIFRQADRLGVSTDDYSVWGSSAGARMAAAIGSHGVAPFGGDNLPKPAAVVMAYTGHADVSSDEPPTFVVVGERDGIAPPFAMERRIAALRHAGTVVEYHKYPNLGHGFGLGTGTSAEGWIDDALRFWDKFTQKRN
jgi:acetyl esterase/lipase